MGMGGMQRGVPRERLRLGAARGVGGGGVGEVLSAFSPQVKRSCTAKCWRWITPCPKSSGERGAAGRGGTGPCICTHAHTRGGEGGGRGSGARFYFRSAKRRSGRRERWGGSGSSSSSTGAGRGCPRHSPHVPPARNTSPAPGGPQRSVSQRARSERRVSRSAARPGAARHRGSDPRFPHPTCEAVAAG